MGRRRGDEKRTTDGAEVEEPGFTAQAGELPLFYATSPKLTRSRQVGRSRRIGATSAVQIPKAKSGSHVSRREVSADVHLGEGHPVGTSSSSHSQEITTWATSYRFDLNSQDAGRLQAMLERDARSSGRNLIASRHWMESPGGSFRFEEEEEEEETCENSQRQREAIHGNRFVAMTVVTANGDGSQKQAGYADAATLQSSDCRDVVSFEAPRNVAVDVPNSPERDEILRRLSKLKSASPSLLRFGLDDVTSPSLLRYGTPSLDDVVAYHKEMAKLAARRDHLHQRLMTDSCIASSSPLRTTSSSSSTPVSKKNVAQEITATLGELEIMPLRVERRQLQSNSLPTRPRRTAAQSTIQELHPITPTTLKQSPRSRRRSSCSVRGQIVSVRKLQFPVSCNILSPDHTPFLSAARGTIPFKWEEEPGKPKAIATALKLPQEEEAVSNGSEKSLPVEEAEENIVVSEAVVEVTGTSSVRSSPNGDGVDNGRVESHRYYGRAHLRGHSETSLEQSSRRYGTHEGRESLIDLDASAAAKFLVELYDTPLSTPGRHSTSLMFAVPFKWEDAPGKAKVETPVGRPNMLQLPPRLAVPSCRGEESFSRDLRGSHPFVGLFAPCLTASSPGQQQQQHQRKQSSDRMLVQYGSSNSLPPRPPTPPERRRRHGLVGRCYSAPQERCQIRVPKSSACSPVLQAVNRNMFSEETDDKNSPSAWLEKSSSSSNANANAPSSPRSILCGPDSGSQTSASNVFSSGDLEDFTQQTNHESGQSASKSSNSSFESIEEDFAEQPPLHSGGQPQGTRPQEEPPNAMKDSLRNLPDTSQKQQPQEHATQCPEPAAWSPDLADYFQSLQATSTSAGAPPTSGDVNSCEGELPLPSLQPMLQQQEFNSSAEDSPKRPTRLPYTMPDQQLASGENSTRRQLMHDRSPRVVRQSSGRRLNRSSHGRIWGGIARPPRVERYHADEVCQTSPAYAAALQLLSPPVNLVTQRHRKGLATSKLPLSKHRRRARFMMSICKSLKRLVLGRQRRCKAIEQFEPKLMYDYSISPTDFEFYKPH